MTMIPEPTGRRAYGMRGAFRFNATAPPFRCPVLTDEWDLGPLVSAWVCGAHGAGTKHRARWAIDYRGRIYMGWN
jgi:hypothetical protein